MVVVRLADSSARVGGHGAQWRLASGRTQGAPWCGRKTSRQLARARDQVGLAELLALHWPGLGAGCLCGQELGMGVVHADKQAGRKGREWARQCAWWLP